MDQFADYLKRKRDDLPLSELSDDQLANALYLHGDRVPPIESVLDGSAKMPIVYLTAAKERIRWLTRQLDQAIEQLADAEIERVQEGNEAHEQFKQDDWYRAAFEALSPLRFHVNQLLDRLALSNAPPHPDVQSARQVVRVVESFFTTKAGDQ